MKRFEFNKTTHSVFLSAAMLLFGVFILSFVSGVQTRAATWLSTKSYASAFEAHENGVYKISNANQLARLAYLINQSSLYNTYSTASYELVNNIDISAYDWEPIGVANKPFKGNFFGNGHVISGLFITNNQNNAGLFGLIDSASLQHFMVSGNISFSQKRSDIGGIVGSAKNSEILMVSNHVSISLPSSSYVGGIVGSYENNITISKSYNIGSVEADSYVGGLIGGHKQGESVTKVSDCYNNSSFIKGKLSVGGVAGKLFGSTNKGSYLARGYNNAAITNTGTNTGGIVGVCSGIEIDAFYNYARITGKNSVGGIAGQANSLLSNLTNQGVISGAQEVGGIVGASASPLRLNNVNNFASVTGSGNYVGGILGGTETNAGSVSINKAFNSLTVKGGGYVGGIAGGGRSSSYSILYAANHGRVEGSFMNVGGIFGGSVYQTIGRTRYAASILVEFCYNTGTVDGTDYRGGLVGHTDPSSGVIYHSYSSGKIVKYSKVEQYWLFGWKTRTVNYNNEYVGALIGRNKSNIAQLHNLHYISGNSEPDYGLGTSGGGGTDKESKSHSNLTSLKNALGSSTSWDKSYTAPRLSSVSYRANDNLSNFDNKVWQLNTSYNINAGKPFLLGVYW